MAVQILRKLSMKALVGNVKSALVTVNEKNEKILAADGTVIPVAKVIGIGNGTKSGESNYGPWTALLGQFIAEPLAGENKGKSFRTGQLFLPDVALNLVIGAVENLAKGDSVQFAFQINIIANSETGQGYEYSAELLMEPTANDPLELLAKNAGLAATPALPAPTETVDAVTGEVKTPAKK